MLRDDDDDGDHDHDDGDHDDHDHDDVCDKKSNFNRLETMRYYPHMTDSDR